MLYLLSDTQAKGCTAAILTANQRVPSEAKRLPQKQWRHNMAAAFEHFAVLETPWKRVWGSLPGTPVRKYALDRLHTHASSHAGSAKGPN